MSKPARQPDGEDTTRDEVIRALLDLDHDESDELGRTPNGADDDGPPHSSPREQAAVAISLLKVDE